MNLVTNTNRVSTEALSHGLTWGSHRYIRREGTPGNYRYIYPEDVQSFATRVKNTIQSRNAPGATLFGNSINRRAYQNKASLVSKMEKNYNRASRQVTRGGKKIVSEVAKSTDPSRSEKYRKRHQEKLQALRSAQAEKVSALKDSRALIEDARRRMNSAKVSYDRTRKIDDIAPSVISEFKKLFRPDASVELSKNEVMSRGIGGHSAANKTMVFLQPDGTFKRVRGKKVG